ncbi:unnamed protein product [marine sediment metagenome]|uniref:Uncharacterized protein n=1 Tax=marine sediment metagenome TaxID=412755 RepID=X1CVY9_9ZZZZ
MNHKMVNLCDASKKVADEMPNFSKWVRDELLKRSSKPDKEIPHHICGNFVRAKYSPYDQVWFGYCEQCDVSLEWNE